jgi:hypothetical protein
MRAMQARMDIDYDLRVELLRMTVMRRATDLRSDGDRRRFAENMAFVYRMDEAVVRAVLDDVLGMEEGAAPA